MHVLINISPNFFRFAPLIARRLTELRPDTRISVIAHGGQTVVEGFRARTSGLKIEKFVVIPGQFSSANGEFTQMGKLRRGFVTEKYNKLIDAIYGGKDAVDAKASKNFGLKSAIKIRKL